MSFTVSGQNGTFNTNFDEDPELSTFKNELKSTSLNDLLSMLKEDMSIAEMKAILEELASRKIIDLEISGTPEDAMDSQRIRQLLLALMIGSISESDKEDLAKLLGIDISALDKMVEKPDNGRGGIR